MSHKCSILILHLGVTIFLSACSSQIPSNIRHSIDGAPELTQVGANPKAYLSQGLRWGGIILATENREKFSRLTIVGFPLNDNGRPSITSTSPGRFFADVDDFLEPLVYSRDREITVIGKLVKTEVSKVGEFDYEYPVVDVEEFYLWPLRPKTVNYNPPYYSPYYRPYFNPYYPFHTWPYYRPHQHH